MSTAWMTKAASEKQMAFVQKLADEKQVGTLSEAMQDQIADVASGQSITGGEASALIDALLKADRKVKPSAGFAPLVSGRAARLAKFAEAQAEAARLTAEAATALAAAGGKTGLEGNCATCGHRDHDGKVCRHSQYISLGWDDGYSVVCECDEFVAVTAAQNAARTAEWDAHLAREVVRKAEFAAEEFVRGDEVVVARGRKIKKGSTGQIIKVSEGQYGMSAFLLLADGSKAWTSLSNIDHKEG